MKFQIENYENMTSDEKVAALEAYEPDMSGFVAKSVFDKTASDLAAAKKSLKEKMTEDEAKASKEAEEREALIARVKELEHKETVGNYTNSLLSLGYDEKMAKATAEAMATGDMATVFANQKLHNENREKTLRAELLKETPPPAGGKKDDGMTMDKFKKMSPQERYDFSVKNPDEYKTLYGGS